MTEGYPKLRRYMAENDISTSDMAEAIGVSRSYFFRVLNGKEYAARGGFRRDEMLRAKEAFNMTDEEFLTAFFHEQTPDG